MALPVSPIAAMDAVAMGMRSAMARMDVVAHNMANVSTPGYKREISIDRTFDAVVDRASIATQASPSVLVEKAMDASGGPLRATGRALDLAIDGDGFFEVMTDTGAAYTRQGSFTIDARGQLVNEQGMRVMGLGGEIGANGNDLKVDADGQLRDGDRVLGQLKIVRFAHAGRMQALGNGLLTQGNAETADAGVSGQVRSGYLEASNVNSTQEMVALMQTVRHFESMQRFAQGYDDSLERAIRKLGELS